MQQMWNVHDATVSEPDWMTTCWEIHFALNFTILTHHSLSLTHTYYVQLINVTENEGDMTM